MPPAAASLRPVVVCFVAALVLLLVPVSGIAQSPQDSPVVRISQVYGSGGGSTSPYGCDFVELFNSSSQPVELAGWSVQTYSDRWYVFRPGTIKIPGSSYYLLAKQPCADGKRPSVPTPDYAAVISVNPGQGRVALVRNEEVISGKSDPDVVDFVGYGSAPEYEGSGPAPASANTLSPQRKDGGCRDQDDNKTDFEALTPLARNTAAPQHACPDVAPLVQSVNPPDGSGGVATDGNLTIAFSEPVALSGDWFRIECDLRADLTPGNAAVTGGPAVFTVDPHEDLFGDDTCVLTVYAEGVKDQDAGDPPDLMENDYHSGFTTAAGACGDRAYPIHDLQGRSAVSPVNGLTRTVEGVVTGDFQGANGLGGFFMEEEAADQDGDAETSEGILARDGDAALLDVSAGRRVRVTGRVTEIDGNTALAALTRVSDCGESEMPAAVAVEFPAPAADGWERVEGMRVRFAEALTVAGSDELGLAGKLQLVAGERPLAYTQLYAPDAAAYAAFRAELDGRTITLDDGSDAAYPDPILYPSPGLTAGNTVRVGDQVAAGLTAIVDGRGYRLQPTAPPVFGAANPRQNAPEQRDGNLRAGFLALGDYFTPNDGAFGPRGASSEAELERQQDKLVPALLDLDAAIIGVSGLENDGSAPGSALADLVAALNAATKPGAYAAIDSGATWGSGATAVGLVYRTDRVHPVGSPAILTTGAFSQVGSEPPHAPPMAQTFEEATWGERLTVIVNQWRGRGGCPADGADADQGDGQGCWNAARAAAATELADWAASDPTGSADPDRLILGELNAFRLETPLQNLRAAGFVDLVEQFSGEQAVSYLWAGAGGYADCALASASLAGQARAAAIWSINADEPSALDYQTENKSAGQLETLYAADAFRSSDRNPVVVDLALMPDQSDLGGEYGLAWHTGQGEWRLGSAWGGADDGALRGAGSWNDGQGEVSVSVGGPAGEYGCLYAWLDYSNGDAQPGAVDSPNGRWDANEEVVRGLPLPPAKDQGVTFALPVGVIDAMGAYNMRFRLIPAPEPSRADCGAAEVTEPGPTGRADGGEVEDWTFSSGPLAVTIGAFAARLYGDTTTVTWETVDEIDLVGFDVFAATGQEGPWERVNGGLIPARAPGSTEGASYTLSYRSGAQVRWHRLEALETSGARYAFGPLAADETRPTVVRLRAGSAQRVSNGWATAAYLGCIAAAICLWICLRRKMR